MEGTFISYAREDDEPFVKRLFGDLKKRGLIVWWDRKAMESRGRTFLDEIRDAIASVERVILVVGPKAITSPYVKLEWEFALQACKVIVPILRLGSSRKVSGRDYKLVPAQLDRLHTIDFRKSRPYREALDELLGNLRKPVEIPGKLYGVDTLPPHYLARPEPLTRLKEMVVADSLQPKVITSAEAVTALEGMVGIGKSVLAAAFARSCETRRKFNDGVLWLRLGRSAVVTKVLAFAGRALDDDPGGYPDPETGSVSLSKVLENRNCLLILDDIWELADAVPFLNALGPDCRAVITTHDAGLASALEAQELRVDVMTPDEALTLVSQWSGQPVAQLPTEAGEVADECGRLPLALAMIGAMVKNKPANRWKDVLELLQNAELESIRQSFPNYPYPDLLRAIQVSVRALGPEETQRRYLDFAVFADDTPVPEKVIEVFWQPLGLSKSSAHQLIDLFLNRSLMHRGPTGRLSWHNLQLDYVRKQCSDLPSLHRRLLEAYQSHCAAGWHTGPNDGYFFSHLIAHLTEAGRGEEVHHVLAAETAEGRNGWYEAKEAIGDGSGYRMDVARAWQLAKETGQQPGLRPSIGLECRYALVSASLNSVGGSIPPPALSALVRDNIWTADHALSYAIGIAEPKLRAEALAALAIHLSEPLVRTALGATGKAEALAALGPRLAELGHPLEALDLMLKPPAQPYDELEEFFREAAKLVPRAAQLGYPEQALSAVPKLHHFERAEIWSTLGPLLPRPLLPKALKVAVAGMEGYGLASALAALAPYLPKTLLPDALDAALRIGDEMNRVRALGGLEPYLPEPLLRNALAHARQIENVLHRARALVGLAIRLPKGKRRTALSEALAAVRQIEHHAFRADALAELAPHLTAILRNKVFRECLKATERAGDAYEKRETLVRLAPRLPANLLRDALLVAQGISDAAERARTLAELIPHLPTPLQQRTLHAALALARGLPEVDERTEALIRIVPLLAGTNRQAVLDEVLADALREEGVREPAHILGLLMPELPETLLRRVLEAVPQMEPIDQAEVLSSLVPFLTEPLWAQAAAAARLIPFEDSKAAVLAEIASHVSGPLQSELVRDALSAAATVPGKGLFRDKRPQVMAEVAAHLPGPFLDEALALMRQISDDPHRTEALAGLAPYLSEPLLQDAFDAVLRISDRFDQTRMLGAIALRFADLGLLERAPGTIEHMWMGVSGDGPLAQLASRFARQGHFKEALAAASEIESGISREESLSELAPILPEPLLSDALSAARAVEPDYVRYRILCKLFPRLPEPLKGETFQELLGLAQSVGPHIRWTLFTELAPHLADDRLREAIAFLRDASPKPGEPETVLELAHYLPEPDRSNILRETLAAAKKLPESDMKSGRLPRVEALIRIISVLSGPPRQDALAAALAASRRISDPQKKAAALNELAAVLEEPQRSAALAEALAAAAHISYPDEQAAALRDLAPKLTAPLLLRALKAARKIGDEEYRVKALSSLAVHFPEPSKTELIAEAWAAAAAANVRTRAFHALAAHLPEPRRTQALNEAIAEARAGYLGHKDVANLADYLPSPLRADVLRDALATAFETDYIDSVTALGELAPHLGGLAAEDLLPIARQILHRLAQKSRQELLPYFEPLGPIIFELGGQQAVEETFRAILDVGRWWP